MYVSRHGAMTFNLPIATEPQKIARLEPLRYDELVDPGFRRLLAAFHGLAKVSAH
jgi:hypothetical protein